MELGQGTIETEALLDTGFDGSVVIPSGFLEGRAPDWFQRWRLADGSEAVAPTYLGTVQVGDFQPSTALIIALGEEFIVGLEVIRLFTVILDHGQEVSVKP